jgi:hypothetical protein
MNSTLQIFIAMCLYMLAVIGIGYCGCFSADERAFTGNSGRV